MAGEKVNNHGFYNTFEIKGVISNYSGVKTSKSKKVYATGTISMFTTLNDEEHNYYNKNFVAFEHNAETFKEKNVTNGQVLTIRGSLRVNVYNGKKYEQLVVSSFLVHDKFSGKIKDNRNKAKNKAKKEEHKNEKAYFEEEELF